MNIDIRDAFFDKIYELGMLDRDLIVITNDMDAFGLREFRKHRPEQFINVGVAEQNMINVAAGLSSCNKKVFIYGIASFVTLRCYEQIKFNICSMMLPVTIIGMGSGLSFSYDGPTHHAIQDVAIMRALPEMSILNPSDIYSSRMSAEYSYQHNAPLYVRLDKGSSYKEIYKDQEDFLNGYKIVNPLQDINIVSTGIMTNIIMSSMQSTDVGLVDIVRLKPVNVMALQRLISVSKGIIIVEENSATGGLYSIIAEILAAVSSSCSIYAFTLQDKQILEYGTREYLHSKYGLDIDKILSKISCCSDNRRIF